MDFFANFVQVHSTGRDMFPVMSDNTWQMNVAVATTLLAFATSVSSRGTCYFTKMVWRSVHCIQNVLVFIIASKMERQASLVNIQE